MFNNTCTYKICRLIRLASVVLTLDECKSVTQA